MKLNLHILKEDMAQWNLKGHLPDPPTRCMLTYPQLCSQLPQQLSPDILYVIPADALPKLPEQLSGISILSIGRPILDWLTADCNFLYTEVSAVPEELNAALLSLFYRYQEWEASLQLVLDEHRPLADLAKVSSHLIHNAIYAQGGSYHVYFSHVPRTDKPSASYLSYLKNYKVPNDTHLSAEAINTLISDPEYIRSSEAVEPVIYQGVPFGFRSLIYNLRADDTLIGRLTIDEILEPITNREFALIQVLGSYVRKAILSDRVRSFTRPAKLDDMLQKFLDHRLVPERQIQALLDNYQWKIQDTYLCMVLSLNVKGDDGSALDALAFKLSTRLSSEVYTIYRQDIVFICNLTVMKRTEEELFSLIQPTLRDNLLTAATSMPYRDFKNLYYYYRQTIAIRELGEKQNPTFWYFHTKDYLLDYLLEKCTERTIPDIAVPEGLYRLLDHDRRRGSDYANLLRLYLDHERSTTETTKAAFLHRNTLHYRIQRIQEIVGLDLDVPENRLLLQLAFRILDHSKTEN